MKWFLKVLRHYADFSGRARRKEYWMFALFNSMFALAWSFLGTLAYKFLNDGNSPSELGSISFGLSYSIMIMLPSLAVVVRRLHDLGKSGWMILIVLIPLIGAIWLFVLMVTEGQPEENKYGTNPKTSVQTFSQAERMKNAGVTFIVISALLFILYTCFLALWTLIAKGLHFSVSSIFNYICIAMMLAMGILLLKEKQIFKIQGKGRIAITLLLIINILYLVSRILILIENNSYIYIYFFIVFNILNILFAVCLLFSQQNKYFINLLAILVILFSGILLLIDVYSTMKINLNPSREWLHIWFEKTGYLYNLFRVLFSVPFIVLSGTFLSKKVSSSEEATTST